MRYLETLNLYSCNFRLISPINYTASPYL
ncbi:hypothetical protein V12B01_12645 [Vibrio splendidus 12B01]|nr:hypothetical protein V12B01_12645 [Vibrio splendidus 12B01]